MLHTLLHASVSTTAATAMVLDATVQALDHAASRHTSLDHFYWHSVVLGPAFTPKGHIARGVCNSLFGQVYSNICGGLVFSPSLGLSRGVRSNRDACLRVSTSWGCQSLHSVTAAVHRPRRDAGG